MLHKDMAFLQRAANKQRGRAYSQRKNRRMTRSNARLTVFTEAQRTVASILRALRKRSRHKANPLSVNLRPWVPHVRETLARKDAAALYLSAAIRQACTKRQWQHLCSTCLELMPAE